MDADEISLQRLICWLEDVHIRRWSKYVRGSMRSSPFDGILEAYTSALELPAECATDAATAVSYLLDVALSLYFDDCADVFNTPVDPWAGRTVPEISGAAENAEVQSAVRALLAAVNIEEELNAADASEIVADIVEQRLSDNTSPPTGGGIDKLPLASATGDVVVDQVITVMRLLHVAELSKLQTAINDVIANMQSVTADPKINARLGKVGQ